MKQKPRLVNWRIMEYYGELCLDGEVYDHPNPANRDGERVITSPLRYINFEAKIAATKNNEYLLGTRGVKYQ